MAHLKPTSRGQLLIVGGVVVAFAVVGLAIVLNTVVLTESLETREPPRGLDDAREQELVVERATGRLITAEEHVEYDSWPDAHENATGGVERIGSLLGNRTLQESSVFANTSVNHTRQGAVLEQTAGSRDFSAAGGTSNWTLVTTTGIRNFRMTVDASNTVSKSDPGNFTVVIEGDGGTEWSAAVYANGSRVEVHAEGTTCTSTATNATINWTTGELDGCSFPFARSGGSPASPYTLRFENGSNASGVYHLVVSNETSEDSVQVGNFVSGPRTHPAVYSLVVTVVYDGPNVDWDTDVRVAPGEPPQTSPA